MNIRRLSILTVLVVAVVTACAPVESEPQVVVITATPRLVTATPRPSPTPIPPTPTPAGNPGVDWPIEIQSGGHSFTLRIDGAREEMKYVLPGAMTVFVEPADPGYKLLVIYLEAGPINTETIAWIHGMALSFSKVADENGTIYRVGRVDGPFVNDAFRLVFVVSEDAHHYTLLVREYEIDLEGVVHPLDE